MALGTYPAVFGQDVSHWKWEWGLGSGAIRDILGSKGVGDLS